MKKYTVCFRTSFFLNEGETNSAFFFYITLHLTSRFPHNLPLYVLVAPFILDLTKLSAKSLYPLKLLSSCLKHAA